MIWGCFATDFDAQAHCIKIIAKTGAFTPALLQNHIKVLVKAGLSPVFCSCDSPFKCVLLDKLEVLGCFEKVICIFIHYFSNSASTRYSAV